MKKNLKELLIDELHDILSSEEQIVKALPEMAKAAQSLDLQDAFNSHLKETKGQIQRLDKIFKLLKVSRKEKFCKATKGLIQECKEVLTDFKTKSPVRDAALISKAQRIEHYEISAYGTVRTFAKQLGESDVVDLLDETLKQEGNADKTLTKIAVGGLLTSGVNQNAITPAPSKFLHSSKPKRVSSTKKNQDIKMPRAKKNTVKHAVRRKKVVVARRVSY